MRVALGQWEMLLLELLIPPVIDLSVCKDELMLGTRAWLPDLEGTTLRCHVR